MYLFYAVVSDRTAPFRLPRMLKRKPSLSKTQMWVFIELLWLKTKLGYETSGCCCCCCCCYILNWALLGLPVITVFTDEFIACSDLRNCTPMGRLCYYYYYYYYFIMKHKQLLPSNSFICRNCYWRRRIPIRIPVGLLACWSTRENLLNKRYICKLTSYRAVYCYSR